MIFGRYSFVHAADVAEEAWPSGSCARLFVSEVKRARLRQRVEIAVIGVEPDGVAESAARFDLMVEQDFDDTLFVCLDTSSLLTMPAATKAVVAFDDPFAAIPRLATVSRVAEKDLKLLTFRSLAKAQTIFAVGERAQNAMQLIHMPHRASDLPPTPVFIPDPDWQARRILIVDHCSSTEAYQNFVGGISAISANFSAVALPDDDASPHADPRRQVWRRENPVSAIVHLGPARQSLLGARLQDAWASNVPVFQLVTAEHGRALGDVVAHWADGLLFSDPLKLKLTLAQFAADTQLGRSLAASARTRIRGAKGWGDLVQEVAA